MERRCSFPTTTTRTRTAEEEEEEEECGPVVNAKRLSGVYSAERTPKRRRRLDFAEEVEMEESDKENKENKGKEDVEEGVVKLGGRKKGSPMRERRCSNRNKK
ncbi:hypothetical protein A3770_11p62420 [Chloropicon primus]|uniref:Uncharacterized protein n=1 Tax=Chloropicon primus TaxID=1764295 RepID=A0A5B8MVI0_9CHLO|nr:hypothetical protein A3770_11p62420 [Chloropicon primus]|eukprot:QDZ23724.1 hypothetical protein A3770_11p62420 [Chloropicon primus]